MNPDRKSKKEEKCKNKTRLRAQTNTLKEKEDE